MQGNTKPWAMLFKKKPLAFAKGSKFPFHDIIKTNGIFIRSMVQLKPYIMLKGKVYGVSL